VILKNFYIQKNIRKSEAENNNISMQKFSRKSEVEKTKTKLTTENSVQNWDSEI
jgi:hypothetical protein